MDIGIRVVLMLVLEIWGKVVGSLGFYLVRRWALIVYGWVVFYIRHYSFIVLNVIQFQRGCFFILFPYDNIFHPNIFCLPFPS